MNIFHECFNHGITIDRRKLYFKQMCIIIDTTVYYEHSADSNTMLYIVLFSKEYLLRSFYENVIEYLYALK